MMASAVALPEVQRRSGPLHLVSALARDGAALTGAIIIAIFTLAAVFAPLLTGITGQDPYTYHQDLLNDMGVPVGWGGGISATHWFGVEPLTGRDLFAIVVYGARTSMLVGIGATIVAMILGVVIGLTSGYIGGWYDRAVSRVVDVVFGFPVLVLLIALAAIVPTSFPRELFLIIIIGLLGWPGIARMTRGQALTLRERNFVVASKAMGARAWHVMLSQVLPNASGTVIVIGTIIVPYMIGVEATLSFLGVGVPPPTPSWGGTIGNAIGWMQISPMYLVFPGAALFFITLAFNLFGDGLRDVLDPRGER